MTWNVHPTISTGSTFTADNWNTYIRDNLNTLFPYTAANQIAFSTSTTSLSKTGIDAALHVLRSNSTNSSIEFGKMPVVYRRQGYSSSDWATSPIKSSTAGTLTNYTPTNTIIQVGAAVAIDVTFPVPFLYPPIVFIFQSNYGGVYVNGLGNYTTSTHFVVESELDPFGMYYWIALGEI